MRVHLIPARYRPELEARLQEALRTIAFDMKMRELYDGDLSGAEVSARYLHDVDESKLGMLVVAIGEPQTGTVPDLMAQLAAAERAKVA